MRHTRGDLSLICTQCAELNRQELTYSIDSGNHEENDVKEPPTLPRCERCELRLTPQVVQSSDSRRTAAPHLPQAPDQTRLPDQSDPQPTAKDDIVGWPDELLIDSANVTNRTLD